MSISPACHVATRLRIDPQGPSSVQQPGAPAWLRFLSYGGFQILGGPVLGTPAIRIT